MKYVYWIHHEDEDGVEDQDVHGYAFSRIGAEDMLLTHHGDVYLDGYGKWHDGGDWFGTENDWENPIIRREALDDMDAGIRRDLLEDLQLTRPDLVRSIIARLVRQELLHQEVTA